MTSFGTVRLHVVWAMLDECAPGHRWTERVHNWVIMWNGRTHWYFPKGAHGRRKNPEIEIGHVKQLGRSPEISAACAHRHIPQVRES